MACIYKLGCLCFIYYALIIMSSKILGTLMQLIVRMEEGSASLAIMGAVITISISKICEAWSKVIKILQDTLKED